MMEGEALNKCRKVGQSPPKSTSKAFDPDLISALGHTQTETQKRKLIENMCKASVCVCIYIYIYI